jgi:hypothetical protein
MKLKMFITGPTYIGNQVSSRFLIERLAIEKLSKKNYSNEFLMFLEKIINDLTKNRPESLFSAMNNKIDNNELQ